MATAEVNAEMTGAEMKLTRKPKQQQKQTIKWIWIIKQIVSLIFIEKINHTTYN